MGMKSLAAKIEQMANDERTKAESPKLTEVERISALAKANAYLDVVLMIYKEDMGIASN